MLFVIEKNENQSIYNFNIHHKGIAGGKKARMSWLYMRPGAEQWV